MFKKHASVRTTRDFPDDGLGKGAFGKVLAVVGEGTAYLVELNNADGKPLSTVFLEPGDIELMPRRVLAASDARWAR
ncbi:MAG: DUF4926 domain-containing protein [Ramlibacter sp.]|nr:DUF4926 domain-containing protein [Ramlibacter sp.]